jgi:GH24 family phage-related lysozyme (muramidase)
MKSLRKGDRGPEVRQLQEKLIAAGYRLIADAHFWNNTDTALRAFQRKRGLIPDGIAGSNTWKALTVADKTEATSTSSPLLTRLIGVLGGPVVQAALLAKNFMPPSLASRPASQLHISENGLKFIYTLEAFPGKSNRLHWPEGSSGVTLGPGYDMKERSETTIVTDMQAIGVDNTTAKKISKGSGLTGSKANQFAHDNLNLINLKVSQEMNLLKHVVPSYETMVRRGITVDLLQYEFDALVSFAYNPGREFNTVARHVNQGKVAEAVQTIKKVVKSGGNVNKGLINRREREVALYLYNNYGKLRQA